MALLLLSVKHMIDSKIIKYLFFIISGNHLPSPRGVLTCTFFHPWFRAQWSGRNLEQQGNIVVQDGGAGVEEPEQFRRKE